MEFFKKFTKCLSLGLLTIQIGLVSTADAHIAPKVSFNPYTSFPHQKNHYPSEYDYIVVGGGTGGNTVAARLAEAGFTVAVVEAGWFYRFQSLADVPGANLFPWGTSPTTESPIDWRFLYDGGPNLNGRVIHYAQGQTLGGSSVLNTMIYTRPTKGSMQKWADEVQDQSYSWDQVLPFFKKSCNFTQPNLVTRSKNTTASSTYDLKAFSKDGGPVHVSFADNEQPFSVWIDAAFREKDFEVGDGYASGSMKGSQFCLSTIEPVNQTRSSAFTFVRGYLPTLEVITRTLAKRVLFDDDKRAIGVEIENSRGLHTIRARKEVIVSCGAFRSPQMLMVSGIGPAETLKKFGIDVIADRPGVGQNMQDHILYAVTHRVKNVVTSTRLSTDLVYMILSFAKHLFWKSGMLVNPMADYIGWEKVPEHLRDDFSPESKKKLATYPEDWPEIEFIISPGYIGNFSFIFGSQPRDGYQYGSLMAALIAPTSTGTVTLLSDDTSVNPHIDLNWLSTVTDQEVAVAGFKRIREIFSSKALSKILITPEYYPGESVKTNEQILNYIRNNVAPVWHPSCTCKMGLPQDPMAIIDSRARVYGVKGLRVVDASAFPFLIPGHPQSVVYMLGEKIADDIIRNPS